MVHSRKVPNELVHMSTVKMAQAGVKEGMYKLKPYYEGNVVTSLPQNMYKITSYQETLETKEVKPCFIYSIIHHSVGIVCNYVYSNTNTSLVITINITHDTNP